jgi:Txe/YoeB family toxin of Txe-Axe toxin-antitoxin module
MCVRIIAPADTSAVTIAAAHLCERIIADGDSWSSRRIFGQHRLVYRVSDKGREHRLEIAP